MTHYKKCCAQCPGGVLDIPKGSTRWDEVPSYNRFSIAKKLHAENLKHTPLPDKVDYDLIKKMKMEESLHLPCLTNRYQNGKTNNSRSALRPKYHDSVLGCKKPTTTMDLAICWQAPVDSIYEPSRPTHIDGSDGGAAPAIFEFIQHTPNTSRNRLRSNDCNKKYSGAKNYDTYQKKGLVEKSQNESHANSKPDRNNSGHHCKCINSGKPSLGERSKSQYSMRSGVIHADKEKSDPRLIRSAVGIALGTESNDNNYRRLPQKVNVPRPKTPFARRSYSVTTLSPPFSIVNGTRDTDYPEFQRLMTIYQQSYKNPRRYTGHFHY
ncbi:hypothetical protein KPH14_008829 [Odynerus spinipes]|uniref:DUF4812 domain-containing protein n=1 Tax=Odynerus spinipes TaxID=1348599 RepID=A0AAD9VHS8_9HYME|nr:hypothetical protein KPH14_008829 [Odynerus spinipes]